jgi:hypothetical protein
LVFCPAGYAAPAGNPDVMPIQVASAGVIAPATHVTDDGGKTAAPAAARGFQPAPVPDQDADAPSTYVPRGPSLSPALFSHKAEFAGDGYAPASDPDHGLDNRRTPAAGLNWSVPVK